VTFEALWTGELMSNFRSRGRMKVYLERQILVAKEEKLPLGRERREQWWRVGCREGSEGRWEII